MKTTALFLSMLFVATVQAQNINSSLPTEDEDWEETATDATTDEEDDAFDINDIEPLEASHLLINDYGYEQYYLQTQVWRKQTLLRPHDANAWLNYFRHARYMLMNSYFSYEVQEAYLMDILEQMEKEIPNTYEYNFCAYCTTNMGKENLYQYAEKAMEMLPANKKFIDYDTWFAYLHLRCDIARSVPFAKEYFNSGIYSQELIQQNMNELNGMKTNSIFVGNGDATVIPKWLIADATGKHQDKIVLSYAYLNNPEYCQHIYDMLGIGEAPVHEDHFEDYEEYQEFMRNIIQTLADRTGRELYFSKYNGEEINGPWKDNLYDEGLVYHYSPKEYDALKVKRHNFEKVYDLNYLLKPMDENAWRTDKTMSWEKTAEFCDLLDYYKGHNQKRYEQLYAILKNSIDRTK